MEFKDRDAEEGCLLYVAGEFARTGLYYPYRDSETRGRDFCGHSHSFEGVLESLFDDPRNFSIEGYESYYSAQERDMLTAVQEQLRRNSPSRG